MKTVTLTAAESDPVAYAALFGAPQKKAPKFKNIKTTVDGQQFDSKGEAGWFQGLKARVRAGEIRTLERQVKYPLYAGNVLICDYVADATFEEKQDGEWVEVVADFKGIRTPVFNLKAKLFHATYGQQIRCVDSKGKTKLVPHIPKPKAARKPRKETRP